MKLSYTVLLSLQALMAAAGPTKASPAFLFHHLGACYELARANTKRKQSPAQLIKDELSGRDLSGRACNYDGCDGCLGGYSYCRQCNSATSPPSACVYCWTFCAANCGC
ncbi:hypothetical protein B0T16DRAFT_452824 [Cercophora newfieldiana]|uniref:Uncharacterized protein n=1 Tax=Cercophora newfieldiana TaxID=92897 RepID=A0AA39YRM2_9PEZI|nr:hypothetical protein B0T16DRAFT_452824 [Cercophora newfieldiana]